MDGLVCAEPWESADHAGWTRTPLPHLVSNLTTHSLERVERVEHIDGGVERRASYIAKTLRPASASPVWSTIPVEHHAATLEALNWLDEPRLYSCGLHAELSDGLRMPVVHRVVEGRERITIWMEDVADGTPWDLDRYRRTACALGRLNGTWPAAVAAERFGLGHREIAGLFFGKICNLDLPLQRDDAFWAQPDVASVVDDDHRRDLMALADRVPAMIGALDALPRGVCHGDATPGNFMETDDRSIVALDWAFGNVDTIGSDLAQLLAGRYESGDAEVDDIDDIVAALADGYGAGLARAGAAVDTEQWQRAWATHLAIRSVFSALIVEPGDDDDARVDLLRRRAALARFGMEFAGHCAP
jgi:hypothetical protein